ncbi:hypothetical protein [Cobetia sp. MB87]|uniref:hypothetical protein n=1 Tax=Cobetia sp. MB87 TaxID=2588451 RepID=UPI001407B07B|nr:hypothetical protein [Cobetia sp. MB87]
MLDDIKKLLLNIANYSGDDFTGLGIVVYDDILNIPIFPLHKNSLVASSPDVESYLLSISKKTNIFHDGFHFLSSNLSLTHISYYFSPPIVNELEIERLGIGGRYMAAIFGSCLSDVYLTGIVTESKRVVLFVDGVEIYYREVK